MDNITAELHSWWRMDLPRGYVYWGRIHNDAKGRWADGTHIHTSAVVEEITDPNDNETIIVKTLNSVYLLRKDRRRGYDGADGELLNT